MRLSDNLEEDFKKCEVKTFVCLRCGALVPAEYRETHKVFHMSLDKTAGRASYADMMTRPIG
jgi:hypothetical protein